jgi:hypothetical protein
MMNNEFIVAQAAKWAAAVISSSSNLRDRVQRMYEAAFARPATEEEVAALAAFSESQKARPEAAVWSDIAHVLFNSAEFIYVP